MEYFPGGDLMSLFIQKDILSVEESKFYISQMVLAIESIHKSNYIHRDIKPDNVLIDIDGNIKIIDFGLCAQYKIKNNINWLSSLNLRENKICVDINKLKRRNQKQYKKISKQQSAYKAKVNKILL